MGSPLARYVKHVRAETRRDRPAPRPLPPGEEHALEVMRREAKANGVHLASGGVGGLPPSFVLGIFRRDGWRCKVHGDRGEGECRGLTVHHKGGLVAPLTAWLRAKGKSRDRNNLVTVCTKGHDEIHDRDRAAAREEAGDDTRVD